METVWPIRQEFHYPTPTKGHSNLTPSVEAREAAAFVERGPSFLEVILMPTTAVSAA